MRVASIATLLSASVGLSGCLIYPYVGADNADNTPCISFTMPFANDSSSCKGFTETSSYQKKRWAEKKAESGKHLRFTEAQRLNMAEATAKILYPFDRNQATLVEWASGYAYYTNLKIDYKKPAEICAITVANERFKIMLHDKLPESLIYKTLAKEWSRFATDKQLEALYRDVSAQGTIPQNKSYGDYLPTGYGKHNGKLDDGALDALFPIKDAVLDFIKDNDDLLETSRELFEAALKENRADCDEYGQFKKALSQTSK